MKKKKQMKKKKTNEIAIDYLKTQLDNQKINESSIDSDISQESKKIIIIY